jgi:hypothetical protein
MQDQLLLHTKKTEERKKKNKFPIFVRDSEKLEIILKYSLLLIKIQAKRENL